MTHPYKCVVNIRSSSRLTTHTADMILLFVNEQLCNAVLPWPKLANEDLRWKLFYCTTRYVDAKPGHQAGAILGMIANNFVWRYAVLISPRRIDLCTTTLCNMTVQWYKATLFPTYLFHRIKKTQATFCVVRWCEFQNGCYAAFSWQGTNIINAALWEAFSLTCRMNDIGYRIVTQI